MSKIQTATRIYKEKGLFYLTMTAWNYVISRTVGRASYYFCRMIETVFKMIKTVLNKLGFEVETYRKTEFEMVIRHRIPRGLGLKDFEIRLRRTIPKIVDLNETDKYFIEFMSEKRNRPYEEIEAIFLETRDKFNFLSDNYQELLHNILELYRIYDDPNGADEGDVIERAV